MHSPLDVFGLILVGGISMLWSITCLVTRVQNRKLVLICLLALKRPFISLVFVLHDKNLCNVAG